ncbi:MAG: hypothetical protein AAGA18_09570 [Verrucomicrobiota bacterium]
MNIRKADVAFVEELVSRAGDKDMTMMVTINKQKLYIPMSKKESIRLSEICEAQGLPRTELLKRQLSQEKVYA